MHALATPLLTRADGTKFGKTDAAGALWLDPALLSPYAFYQFWLNSADADIGRYLRALSFRTHEELLALEADVEARPAARMAQRALADELTALVHGADELTKVEAASRALFGQGDLAALDAATLEASLHELPTARVSLDGAASCPTVAELLRDAGLAPSLSAARRTVEEGGAYLNNVRVDADQRLRPTDLLHGRWAVLRRGRRNLAGVVASSGPAEVPNQCS